MTDKARSNLRGVAFALLAFGIFASHDVAVKTLGGTYSTFQIIFFSVLFSFPLVTLMLMRDTRSGTLIPVHPWWTAARTLAVIFAAAGAFYAFSVLPLAQVYAILFTAPLLITVFSIPILGERVGIHRWGAVVFGLIGVLIVLRPGQVPLGPGHLAAMTSALCGAFASVVVRKIGKDERTAVLLLYPMMTNFVVMGAILPFVYKPMPVGDLGLVTFVALFAIVAGLLLIQAYRAADAAMVAPMQYSQILWATLYGAIFFDELPDLYTAAGAGVIIASGLYVVIRESRGGVSANTPVLRTRSRVATPSSPRVSSMERRADPAE